jgi:hypothetical protein
LQVRATGDLGVAVSVSSFFVNPRFLTGFLTESIQDTSPRIHPWRNKKPVSDKQAPEFIRGVNASIL